MQLVYSPEFSSHDPTSASTAHPWLFELLQHPWQEANITHAPLIDQVSREHGRFSRSRLLELVGKFHPEEQYEVLTAQQVNATAADYLKSFFSLDTLFVGLELSEFSQALLQLAGIKFINIWFHPVKLFGDLSFVVKSNDSNICARIKPFGLSPSAQRWHAHYWRTRIRHSPDLQPLTAELPEAVFVGQTPRDQSLYFNGKIVGPLDFLKEFSSIGQEYGTIGVLHHPFHPLSHAVLDGIKSVCSIAELSNSTYQVIASNQVKLVFAITSSVVEEAELFGKKTMYLAQPHIQIDDGPVPSTHKYFSIRQELFLPDLWRAVFDRHAKREPSSATRIHLDSTIDIAAVRGLYWGLDKIETSRIHSNKIAEQISALSALANEVESGIGGLRNDVESGVASLRNEVKAEIAALRQRQEVIDLQQLYSSMPWMLKTPIRSLRRRINSLRRGESPVNKLLLGKAVRDGRRCKRAVAQPSLIEATVPHELSQGEGFIPVTVHNNSPVAWRSDGPKGVNISYHWLDLSGNMLVFDGERTPLPGGVLAPMSKTTAVIRIVALPLPQRCKLMLSVVQEGVGWFDESPLFIPLTARVLVTE